MNNEEGYAAFEQWWDESDLDLLGPNYRRIAKRAWMTALAWQRYKTALKEQK